MPNIKVKRLNPAETDEALANFQRMRDRVNFRSRELYEERGCVDGGALEDWLRAEAEVLGPGDSRFHENGDVFQVSLALPGFDRGVVQIAAGGQDLLVRAERKEPKGSSGVVATARLYHCRVPIDAGRVSAAYQDGCLEIHAPKLYPLED